MRNSYNDHFTKIKNSKKSKTKAETKKSGQPNKKVNKRYNKKKSVSVGAAIGSVVFLMTVLALLFFPDDMEKMVNHLEVSFYSKADAATGLKQEEKKSLVKAETGKNLPDKTSSKPKVGAVDRTPAYARDINYFSKLEEKERSLNKRQEGLVELEADLQKQKKDIEIKISELNNLRGEVSSLLKNRIETDEKKLMKLVEFYSSMKPQKAAGIIDSLDEDLAVEVLNKMKKRNAAAILNLVTPVKAQNLSEKFVGYKN